MTYRATGHRKRFPPDGRAPPVSRMIRSTLSGSSKNKKFCVQSVMSNFLSVSLRSTIWPSTGEPSPAYLTEERSGYAERMFSHTCKHCSFSIDRSKLAVAKFARDFVMDPTNSRDAEKYGNATYLPYVDPSTC